MALDVDEILEKIGPLGKFQIRTVIVMGWTLFCLALFELSPTFLAGDPGWKCKANSTGCKLAGEYVLGMDNFKARCTMERGDWEYLDTFTSILTEVYDNRKVCRNNINLLTTITEHRSRIYQTDKWTDSLFVETIKKNMLC